MKTTIKLSLGTSVTVDKDLQGNITVTYDMGDLPLNDGDFLKATLNDGQEYILIFRDTEASIYIGHFPYYMLYDKNKKILINVGKSYLNEVFISLAPVSFIEKKEMLDALYTQRDMVWDEKKRRTAKYKWFPRLGEKYYYLSLIDGINSKVVCNSSLDTRFLSSNNFFETYEKAEKTLRELEDFFKYRFK